MCICWDFCAQFYNELMDEFMDAVKARYGDKVLVQVAAHLLGADFYLVLIVNS